LLKSLVRWFWESWVDVQDRRSEDKALRGTEKLDLRPMVVLLVCAFSLTLQEYYGDRSVFAKLVPPPGYREFSSGYWELASFVWWIGFRVAGFFLLPLGVLLLLGERIGDYGLSLRGFRRHAWIYVALYLAVLPLVVAVSYTKPFQHTYPFYRLANRSALDLWAWEVLYAAQFFSLEFFFRGFLLFGLRRALGPYAIFVSMVPYCMIHFGKPISETLGAVVAGVILGTLALRTRSIWCGVLIHVSVAVTMDLLALSHCPALAPCPR
jgi:membrane protease YdiL (CAAX protease family)